MRKSGRNRKFWLLPVFYAGIPTAVLATALLIWGKEIADMIKVVLKLAVKA